MIIWLGHASFRFEGSKIIYTDPWQLKSAEPKADIILITHSHYDHCSPEDVAKVVKAETVVVATEDCLKLFKSGSNVVQKQPESGSNVVQKQPEGGSKVVQRLIKPGEAATVAGIKIEAVPAYNINKQFHPKANNWVGYIFELDGQRIYQAGDTDLIPEMKDIKADIALLPVGGTYTMDAKEAAEAANIIKPKVAIPMHWGKIVGAATDAETFKKLAKCEVKILKGE